MAMIEMIAIEGLEDALLGTAYVAGEEVLAYDASVAETLVMFMDPPHPSLHEFITNVGLVDLGIRAPVFIYQDEGMREDFGDKVRRSIH